MALIGKIRKNFWLVLILLGLALAAFVIMDAVNANNRGGLGAKQVVGKVAGKEIDLRDFQSTQSALYSRTQDCHAAEKAVWENYVESAIVDKLSDDSGIGVSGDELVELQFGPNISPVVQNNFRNQQTGQINMEQLLNIKQQIEEGKPLDPGFVNFWKEQQKMIVKTAKQGKMNAIVSKAMFTPTYMVEELAGNDSRKVSFDYVKVPYSHISDDKVSISDADLSSYIQNHASEFTNEEETRVIRYASMKVVPTAADSAEIRNDLAALRNEFKITENDSVFVTNNEGGIAPTYSAMSDLSDGLKDKVLTVGEVYGPFFDNNTYVMAKVLDAKVLPDSAKARHILRSVTQGDLQGGIAAQKYIDSLKAEIVAGKVSFADAAQEHSQDPGSGSKGGDLGTFAQGRMVPAFNDAVFNGKKGGLYTVTTQFGVHLIKVEGQVFENRDPKYKMAYIGSPIVPSQETQDRVLSEMNTLVANNRDLTSIESAVSAVPGLSMKISNPLQANDYRIGQLPSQDASRDMVKWAYNSKTEPGNVSPSVYIFTDNNLYYNSEYVVAALDKVIPAGLQPVSSVRSQIEGKVRNMKKAEQIMSSISGSDLSSIASTFGRTVQSVNSVAPSAPSVDGLGAEPVILSTAVGQEVGSVSKPIEGNGGVFVIKTTGSTPAAKLMGIPQNRKKYNNQDRGKVSYGFMQALKKLFKAEDNRSTYF